MKRIEAVEKELEPSSQTKYVLRDFDGNYYGECGYDLSQGQFDAWVNQQGASVNLVLMKYTFTLENLPQPALRQEEKMSSTIQSNRSTGGD